MFYSQSPICCFFSCLVSVASHYHLLLLFLFASVCQINEKVLNLIPGEADGEAFEDALARVRRCICGGDAGTNEDSDSDVELIADSITVSLRCPVSNH